MAKQKQTLAERKIRFEKARSELEHGIIEKVATAFYTSAMAELMQTHGWNAIQCANFLNSVTERMRDLLVIVDGHRQAREMKEENPSVLFDTSQ